MQLLRSLHPEGAVEGLLPPKGGCRAAAGGTPIKGWRAGIDQISIKYPTLGVFLQCALLSACKKAGAPACADAPAGKQKKYFFFYSLRRATTGSFLAALREGIRPEIRVRKTLMAIRMMAAGSGSTAFRVWILVTACITMLMGMHSR